MNERINQLAEQAGWGKGETQDDCMQCSPFDKEKFAELIVKECLEQIDKIRDGHKADNEDEQALGAAWAGLAVARHFGVED
jgi:hypothetical protein